MQRDFDYTVARNMHDLNKTQTIGRSAAKRTIARLGAIKINTCKAPVLFHPSTAKSLLGTFIAAISGTNLYRKSTFLLDQLHKQVFAKFINIKEEPFLLKALGSAPFDNEGVAPIPRYIVQDGMLQSYVLSNYSARKLDMETTGNAGGVRNLKLEPGSYNFDALLKNMGTGLIAMELIGHGINIVTGDYSKGCAGFWVENGIIKYPVEEITIAGNLKDMFLNILAIGNDLDYRDNIITGSILLKEMTIAGN
jgi:PmbA protein